MRNIERPELADAEFFAGTEAVVSGQPIRLRRTLSLSQAREAAEAEAEPGPAVVFPSEAVVLPPSAPEQAPALPQP